MGWKPECTELCDHQRSIKSPSEVCGHEFKCRLVNMAVYFLITFNGRGT